MLFHDWFRNSDLSRQFFIAVLTTYGSNIHANTSFALIFEDNEAIIWSKQLNNNYLRDYSVHGQIYGKTNVLLAIIEHR